MCLCNSLYYIVATKAAVEELSELLNQKVCFQIQTDYRRIVAKIRIVSPTTFSLSDNKPLTGSEELILHLNSTESFQRLAWRVDVCSKWLPFILNKPIPKPIP